LGRPFVVVARAECFLVGTDEPLAASIERLQRYREAGADCVYAPGPSDPAIIETLLREVPGRHNVLAHGGLTVARLRGMGVRRISIGGSLARVAFGAVARAAREMIDEGTFDFQSDALPPARLENIFKS
jgi:2-methylisocitrate lyase-like PEP mutase family enzyme